ncbi:type IV pilus biogenesis/stability protein PilW [Thiohalobacter sp. IOR34]|uniref:type IV pilus biogenesis/stability protein PilW n=1 Tax=Thiohalobacter sp. IOR34 TaxID=3057176 RepID=UPI0025B0FD9D|nr:type IV pilus biogenesis/stability protein PilW [Thiohalobacter sp. IOR34]WJW76264.1 type IV pilus biogenesis/stability protein PilW [Thiohalobacter sp. IOR34]
MRLSPLPLLLALLLAACTSTQPRRTVEGRSPAEINTELGIGYMQRGMLAVSMEKLQKAIRQDPQLPAAHNAIAVLYERLGENDKAEAHFRKALRLDPGFSRAHNNFGTFLCRRGRWPEAEAHFTTAAADPLYPQALMALANAGICAQGAGDLDKAEDYLRQALNHNPRFAVALLQMARLTLARGQYLRTRAYLQRYQEVARHTPESLWLGIQAERALGDRDAAASYALLLRNKFPDSEQARLLREQNRHDGNGR